MSHGRIPDEIRARVREQAGNRCGYCLSSQHYMMGKLEIDHIIPTARGGAADEENLWLGVDTVRAGNCRSSASEQ